MIAPIILVIAMALKGFFGIDVPTELQDQLVQGVVILAAVAIQIHAIWKNHRKAGDK